MYNLESVHLWCFKTFTLHADACLWIHVVLMPL